MLRRAARESQSPQQLDDASLARFRDIYTRLLFNLDVERQNVLGITSAMDGDGKTVIAAGLASTLAADGALARPDGRPGDIILVSCDQDRAIGRSAPGLLQYLRGSVGLDDVIQPAAQGTPRFLPTGGPAPDFPSLIRSSAMGETIQHLRTRFDLVLLDLPPLLATTDGQVLGTYADYLLLIVRAGITPSKLIRQALQQLERDKLVGIVLNDGRRELPGWLEQRF